MNTHAMNTKAGFLKGLLLVSCLIVIVLFFLTMPPTTADAAMQPFGQMLSNADFELGSMTGWSWNGSGSVSVWQNDAQHETPFWGRPGTPYVNYRGTEVIYENNRWNGIIISNANGSIQLFQSVSVTQGQRYRFSAWVYTSGSGVTANLERYSASLGGLVPCASTAEAAYTPVSCEFTASATESMSFILEQGYVSGWARTDDWTLTPISTVPRLVPADTWATLPVRFNTTQYGMRTTMAAWEWNGAMGRTMLQETTDPNQAGIRIVGTYDDASVWFGSTPRWKTNGVKVIELNIYWMDVWDNYNGPKNSDTNRGLIKVVKCHHAKTLF